jgi:catecholate siderophore receptor
VGCSGQRQRRPDHDHCHAADLKPEKTKSIELGTKWDLLDKKLNLTAAVFRNEVTNVASPMVAALHGRQQGGQRHELGFTGQILSNLSVFGGYTYMDSEQRTWAGNAANGPSPTRPSTASACGPATSPWPS